MIDPRGTRFAAAITSAVLAAVLITENLWLLAVQAAVFAIGAVKGPASSPYGMAFSKLVRPLLGPAAEREDAAPPRFAQGVGLIFTMTGLAGFLAGAPVVGYAAVAAALTAAFLNAAFGLCLGCETYLAVRRMASSISTSQLSTDSSPTDTHSSAPPNTTEVHP